MAIGVLPDLTGVAEKDGKPTPVPGEEAITGLE